MRPGVIAFLFVAGICVARIGWAVVSNEIHHRRRMRMIGALKAENRMAEWAPEEVEK
jgi:hypothetical protein